MRPTDQIEADMRLGRKGITEPSFEGVAQHVELLDAGSTMADEVRLDLAIVEKPEAEVIVQVMASLAGEFSAERQAEIKALLGRHSKVLLTGDHAIVDRHIDINDVRQTSQLLRRQAFELAKFRNRETDVMLEHDVITVAASPWASNVIHVADAPLRFGVDCSRLYGTSSQKQTDAHENSAKVAALGNGTELQLSLIHI